MSPNLMELFLEKSPNGKNSIPADDIVSLSYGIQKRTGERFAKAILNDGTSYIRTLSKNGVDIQSTIKIPRYSSKDERDDIVMDLLRKNYRQDDIADFIGISQSTVHNIKKKNQK